MMFTENERQVLSLLRTNKSLGLTQLAEMTGLARSSAHAAVQNLVALQVVHRGGTIGKALYSLAQRDDLERAAQNMLAEFRATVLPEVDLNRHPVLSFVDNYVLPEVQLQELRSLYDVRTYDESHAYISDDVFEERSADADVIVKFDRQTIDRKFLSACSKLKAIVFVECCVTNVDLEACEQFGVELHIPDQMTHKYYASTQVEYALNAVLTLMKPLSGLRYQLDNVDNFYDWRRNVGQDVFGKRYGIVFENGNVGNFVQAFELLGCRVSAANTLAFPPLPSHMGLRSYSTIEEMWQSCDIFQVIDGVHIDIEQLLRSDRVPPYLILASGYARYNAETLRELVLEGRIKGLAIDELPDDWAASESQEQFAAAIDPLRDLPNTYVTSEAQVFSKEAIARSHIRVANVLKNLAPRLI